MTQNAMESKTAINPQSTNQCRLKADAKLTKHRKLAWPIFGHAGPLCVKFHNFTIILMNNWRPALSRGLTNSPHVLALR